MSVLPKWAQWAALLVLMLGLGAAASYGISRLPGDKAHKDDEPAKPAAKAADETVAHFAESKWSGAGIRIEPAAYTPFTERAWRSGRLTLNESRVAHLSPMVEGIVREVPVRLGQDVKAGEILALLDCREVGQVKLDLVKSRMAAEYARAQQTWSQTVSRNATELVQAMTDGAPVADIEKQFANRPIGDLRQQLMTAYSHRHQARVRYESVTHPDVQGAVPQSNVVKLRADLEAAEATFRALCEEMKFQTAQQVRAGEQKVREAQTAEAMSKSTLMMLGYSREEVDAMDPIAEGPKVSLYPIRAPFAGTVIELHSVLAERVGPQVQMFRLADLSTLWLQADIPQKDLPLVRALTGSKVRFRINEEAEPGHEATVFYTGDVVDKTTRAVALTAAVPNPDRTLKSGMFVEVELVRPGGEVVQVPASAIQRHGTQPFVFVHDGKDEFRRVDVKLGRESNGVVEILDGLKSGQPVAVAGGFILKSELFRDQFIGE